MVSGPLWSRASSAAKSVRHSPALVMLCSARSLSAWWLLAITHHSCGAVIRLALFFISLRSGNLHPGRTLCRRCQHPVDGNGSGAANHQKSRNRKHEQVILEGLALLCSGPVHKEAEPIMNHRYGHNHIEEDSKAGNWGREPRIRPRPPKNSAVSARNANSTGMCMTSVKKPIVPLKPYPPNQPSIFWAPCAKKITPSTKRRIAVALSLSVEINLRSMGKSFP